MLKCRPADTATAPPIVAGRSDRCSDIDCHLDVIDEDEIVSDLEVHNSAPGLAAGQPLSIVGT